MLLVQATDDVGRHANEGTEGRCGLDAVLPAGPGRTEDDRDLAKIVDEEPAPFLAEVITLFAGAERVGGKQLLQLLCERRLRDTAPAHAKQFDFAVQR